MKFLQTLLLLVFLGFLGMQFSSGFGMIEQNEECGFMTEAESEKESEKESETKEYIVVSVDLNEVNAEPMNLRNCEYTFVLAEPHDVIYSVPFSPPEI